LLLLMVSYQGCLMLLLALLANAKPSFQQQNHQQHQHLTQGF
jgi:hypothetical protein